MSFSHPHGGYGKKRPLKDLFQFEWFRFRSASDLGSELSERTVLLGNVDAKRIPIRLAPQILVLSLVISIVSYFLLVRYDNTKMFPLVISAGAFAVPFSFLVFFWEVNVLRNINFVTLVYVLVVSGVLGIGFSLFLFTNTELLSSLGDPAAGPIEESGKLAAVVLIGGRNRKFPWISNGVLLGAASGIGFAGFESAGYAFETLIQGGSAQMLENILQRGVLSPFGHVVWTAATAGALWRVMNGRPFELEYLLESSFLRVFACSVLLHMAWNFGMCTSTWGVAVIGFIGWRVVLSLVQEGCAQIESAQLSGGVHSGAAQELNRGIGSRGPLIPDEQGRRAGVQDQIRTRRRWTLTWRSAESGKGRVDFDSDQLLGSGGELLIGRAGGQGGIQIEDSSLSRRHAVIRMDRGELYIADCGSSNGTLLNGRSVAAGSLGARLSSQDRFTLGEVEFNFSEE
jgi:RsiW-degrading membrane proteinase PrsW (M82 family)